MKHNWLYSLRFQILAGSIIVLLVLFGLLSLNTDKVLDEFAVENTRTLIKQTSETLNLAVVPQTTEEGLGRLDAYLNELVHGNENGIIYLIVHDEKDRILASSRSVPDPLPDTTIELKQQLDTGVVHVDQPILLADNRIGHLHYGLSTRLLQKINTRLARENLLLLGGGLIVVFILLLITGRRFGSQLGHLVNASQALADGDYKVRTTITGNNELSYLAHNFNKMAKAVAERKNLEAKLYQSEFRFHTLFDLSPDPAWIIGEHKFVECNQAAVSMLGYSSKDELLNTHPSKLSPTHQPDGEKSFSKAERMMDIATEKGLHRFEWVHARADGSDFFAEVTLSAITLDDHPVIFCAWRDITDRKQAEDKLVESESRFRAMFKGTLDGILVADIETMRFIDANPSICAMTGYGLDELMTMGVMDLHAEADQPYVQDQFEKQVRGELQVSENIPILRKDGSSFPVDIVASRLEFNGRTHLVGFFRDITERKHSEEALRNSEERQRAITSAFPDLVFLIDEDGRYIEIISNTDDLLFAEPSEMLGKTLHEVLPAEEADTFFNLIRKTLGTGESQSIEYCLSVPKGMVFFEGRSAPVDTLTQGNKQVVFVARDITERKQAEMALLESQEKYSGIFNESVATIYVFDEDKNFIDTNEAGIELLGYSREELLSMSIADVDADAGAVQPAQEHLLAGGRIVNFEHRLTCKDGHIITVLNNSRPLNDQDGKVIGMQSTLFNITERKQAEHELENNRLHLEELVAKRTATVSQQARIIDQSHDSIVTTDLDGYINSWNSGAEKLFGLQTADVIGKHISKLYPPEEHDFLQQQVIQPLLQKGQHEVETRMRRSDNSVFDAHLSLSLIYDNDGKPVGMIGYSMDITERKRIENALRESEANLAHAQAIAHVGSWHFDIINDQLSWSEETCQIFGLEENTPVTLEYFNSCIHPEDTDRVMTAWDAAKRGVAYDIEHRIIVHGKEKWVREQAEIQFDSNGRAISALGTVQDISENKAAEQKMAEAQQKAEAATRAKSEFLANMSHEIRTPLNAVLGFARMGQRDSHDVDSKQRFSHIMESGEHLLGIINDILDLSKMDAGKLCLETRTFRLAATVEDALDLITEQARVKDLKFSIQIDPNLPAWVKGDSLRLRQILLNLLSNAIKFTNQGEVRLSVKQGHEQIRFTVSDSGIGMNSEQLSRLFTPFDQADSSTTRKYGGSGLGLTISHTLAQLMGGDITAASDLDKGSTFTLCLPLVETDPGVESKVYSMAATDSRLKGVHVLVAEDMELNRLILEDMLEHENARVIFAENGQQALDRLEEHGVSTFDIVLMDIQMPVMDGYEATRRLREIAPALPVIGLTAHAMVEERDKCIAAGMAEHIAKPINVDALVDAILRQLDPPPPAEQETPALHKQDTMLETSEVDVTMPDSLPGIDMDEGLKRLRGKWPTYKRILLLFHKEYKTGAGTMASLLAQENFEEAGRLAHSLKGVSGTLGAMKFYEQAALMEEACNAADAEATNTQLPAFSTGLEEIIDGLSDLR